MIVFMARSYVLVCIGIRQYARNRARVPAGAAIKRGFPAAQRVSAVPGGGVARRRVVALAVRRARRDAEGRLDERWVEHVAVLDDELHVMNIGHIRARI